MRREAKTRESRDLLNSQFWPGSYDDVTPVLCRNSADSNCRFHREVVTAMNSDTTA